MVPLLSLSIHRTYYTFSTLNISTQFPTLHPLSDQNKPTNRPLPHQLSMCFTKNTGATTPLLSSLPGTTQFPQPDAFYCCRCGHGPWLCALYAACIECGHHFDPSHCTPAYTGGERYSSSTSTGPRLTISSLHKASINSSPSIYNNANGLSPNASTEDLTAPNARIPPPVGHSACGLDVFHHRPGEVVGGSSPMTAPATDGEKNWYCCNCGQGPYMPSLYGSCINCNHQRCYYCKDD